MTFTCKCECGAILMVVVKDPSEVDPILKAMEWKRIPTGLPYRAWTDTVPALCDKHNESKTVAGKSPA